jgi:hypothetical protein
METPDVKKPWESSTLWASLIIAVAPFFPPVQAIIAAHPEIVGLFVGGISALLRLKTDSKVGLK